MGDKKVTLSQPVTIPSPRKAVQMYHPTVEETISTKNDTKLELKIYNKYFGNQSQFLASGYIQSQVQGGAGGGAQQDFQSHRFSFDRVFNHEATQNDIFDEVRDVVRSALDGFKVCIFAYGQTCAGKTYTMEGGLTEETLGLVPRSVRMIFETLQKSHNPEWKAL